MKIQILTHGLQHFNETKKMGAWHSISKELAKRNDVDFLIKKDWPFFYFRYLRFRPDILIVTGVIGYYVMKLKKLGLIRCPIVFGWNDYYIEQMGQKWGISKIAKMEYSLVENADFVLTPSKYLYKICEILGKKCEYIPHGVDSRIYKSKKVKMKDGINILYSGTISYYKGIDTLINAVKNKKVNLYLLGNVYDKGILDNIPKNVIYAGFKTPVESFDYVKSADICVIPCDQDSTLKMFEYLALGKPILALNGRINYVLTHGINAYITENLDESISDLIKNKRLLKKLAENAKKYKVYSWQEISKRVEDILKGIIKR